MINQMTSLYGSLRLRHSLFTESLLARRVFHTLLFSTTCPVLWAHFAYNWSTTLRAVILGGLFKWRVPNNMLRIIFNDKCLDGRAGDNLLLIAKIVLRFGHVFLFWELYLVLQNLLVVILVVDWNQQVVWVVSLVDCAILYILNRCHLRRRLRD